MCLGSGAVDDGRAIVVTRPVLAERRQLEHDRLELEHRVLCDELRRVRYAIEQAQQLIAHADQSLRSALEGASANSVKGILYPEKPVGAS